MRHPRLRVSNHSHNRIYLESKNSILTNKKTQLETVLAKIELHKNSIKDLKSMVDPNNPGIGIADEDSLDMIDKEIVTTTELLEETRAARNNLKKSIKLYSEQITDLNFKIDSLKSRITDVKNKDCPICAQKVNTPIITPCCKNVFCFACMAQALHYSSKKECPLCRHPGLDLNKLTVITSDIVEEKEEKTLPTKLESLINLITQKPTGRFLVFSEYDNSFNEIVSELEKNSITFSKLCGSTGHITNLINKYTNNELKVLLLNAKHYGSGLNLQMTTDILIYHRMSNDLEKQVIGRGQRLGRDCALNVHYFCYENEL